MILFHILFSILTMFSMMKHSFQMEELNNLNSLNSLRDSYLIVPPIRIPPRLRKRKNNFLSYKSNFNDKQGIMKWSQNHWKRRKDYFQGSKFSLNYSNDI
jgi:hypothetical protein